MLLGSYQNASRVMRLVSQPLSLRSYSINVAVVGSGPAGFYTTQRLLKHPDVKVDIYEKLPVPFGLVRYGVAPDHAEVKNVVNTFTNIANQDRVNFYGNVSIGESISLSDLIDAYHAVVLCYGSAADKKLGIEGEDGTKNVISARNFVGWYNGLPEDKDLEVNLDCDTACIIGHGNVALDCARVLMAPSRLENTDITTYAQKMLAKHKIRKIYMIGRRGPLQVSFTTKELRELIKLEPNQIRLEPANIFDQWDIKLLQNYRLSRQRRRLTELLHELAFTSQTIAPKSEQVQCVLKFLSKPHRIIADEQSGGVKQLVLQGTRFGSRDEFLDETSRPSEAEEYETIDCGLIIRSIGYKAVPIDSNLPINHKIGAVLNTNGKVHGFNNLYCSGWLATGASGVIAGTLNSSHVTAQTMLSDIESNSIPNLSRKKLGPSSIHEILDRKSVQVVHFNDWLQLDRFEKEFGDSMGKTREKLVDINQMLELIGKSKKE